MEKINANAVALSTGGTASILSAICWVVLAIMPAQLAAGLANNLTHGIDMAAMMSRNLTLLGLIWGIVAWFVIAGISGYIFAHVYNFVLQRLHEN